MYMCCGREEPSDSEPAVDGENRNENLIKMLSMIVVLFSCFFLISKYVSLVSFFRSRLVASVEVMAMGAAKACLHIAW